MLTRTFSYNLKLVKKIEKIRGKKLLKNYRDVALGGVVDGQTEDVVRAEE